MKNEINLVGWKFNPAECSARFAIAAALVCTAASGLRAQEIKPFSKTFTRSAVTPALPEISMKSADLKVSPASEATSEISKISPTLDVSSSNIRSSNHINYSWTSLNELYIDEQSQGNQPPRITVQEFAKDFTPKSSSQSLLAQSTQRLEPQPNAAPASSKSDPKSPEFPVRLYLGPDFFYRDYRETLPGIGDGETGTLFGLQAGLDYVKGNSVYFGLGFRYGAGQTTYDGSDFATGTIPFKSTTDNQFFNIEGRLGYTFQTGQQKHRFLASPFVALGYHQWNRNISGNITTPFGPIQGADTGENYSWGYVGPGFHAEYKVSRKFTIGLNAKLMFMLGGQIDFENKFGGAVLDNGSGKLGNDLQYEIELPITYNLVENSKNGIDLKFTPYYRSQDIALGQPFAVSSGNGIVEPASTTSVYGATVGIQLRF
jgi:hypothetical protein